MGKYFTFWNLLNQYNIKIPIIQRDYAQGRVDDKTTDIRINLFNDLYEALQGKRQVDFDFVYGSIAENTLTPLDGQQRLTSLFLLHWYLGIKENIDISLTLDKFSYQTRVSARVFSHMLVTQPLNFDEIKDKQLSDVIHQKKWFQFQWGEDPTVVGMLVVLNAIHEKFKGLPNGLLELLQGNQCPITFSFLELENFGLSDELYIKMNSRGKTLSTFENFKAQFEQLLENTGSNKASKEFSMKLDHEWTDLLWDYRKEDYTIDQAFVNWFSFITTAMVSKDRGVSSSSDLNMSYVKLSNLVKIYQSKENVEFLFQSLSIWKNGEEIEREFSKISEEVPFFTSDKNLFKRCVTDYGSLTLMERILLYTIVVKKINGQTDIADTVRVVRNLIQRIRQFNNGIENSNLRYDSLGSIFKMVDQIVQQNKPTYEAILEFQQIEGFSKNSWTQEVNKATLIKVHPEWKELLHALEDIPVFKGTIHLLMPSFNKYSEETVMYVKDLVNINISLFIRTLLTIKKFQLHIGWSNLGKRIVFGGGRYKELFWTNNENLPEMLLKLMDKIVGIPEEKKLELKLEQIINEYIKDYQQGKKEWHYYFIKYPKMLEGNNLLFVFADEEKFNIEKLTGVNLQSTHINPFYDTVIDLVNDTNICSHYESAVRLSESSELVTTSGVHFDITDGYWTQYLERADDSSKIEEYYDSLASYDLVEQGVALVQYAEELLGNVEKV